MALTWRIRMVCGVAAVCLPVEQRICSARSRQSTCSFRVCGVRRRQLASISPELHHAAFGPAVARQPEHECTEPVTAPLPATTCSCTPVASHPRRWCGGRGGGGVPSAATPRAQSLQAPPEFLRRLYGISLSGASGTSPASLRNLSCVSPESLRRLRNLSGIFPGKTPESLGARR